MFSLLNFNAFSILDSSADVGMQYQMDSSAQRGPANNHRHHDRSRQTDQRTRNKSTFCATQSVDQTTEQGRIDWKNSTDYDRLVITDLTLNETELADDLDSGSLLR